MDFRYDCLQVLPFVNIHSHSLLYVFLPQSPGSSSSAAFNASFHYQASAVLVYSSIFMPNIVFRILLKFSRSRRECYVIWLPKCTPSHACMHARTHTHTYWHQNTGLQEVYCNTDCSVHTHTHSLAHLLTCSLAHTLTHSLTHSHTHSFTHTSGKCKYLIVLCRCCYRITSIAVPGTQSVVPTAVTRPRYLVRTWRHT